MIIFKPLNLTAKSGTICYKGLTVHCTQSFGHQTINDLSF